MRKTVVMLAAAGGLLLTLAIILCVGMMRLGCGDLASPPIAEDPPPPSAAGLQSASSPPRAPHDARQPDATTAELVTIDEQTKGNWVGKYGSAGFVVAGSPDQEQYPPHVRADLSGQLNYVWVPTTDDPRAPLRNLDAARSQRTAACWYAADTFALELRLLDHRTRQIALYLLEWDNAGRSEKIDVIDAASGAVLLTQSMASFNGGKYLVMRISGHMTIRISKLGGTNCVLSGMFFDDVAERHRR